MSKITTPFSGGCACSAIRFESKAEPVDASLLLKRIERSIKGLNESNT